MRLFCYCSSLLPYLTPQCPYRTFLTTAFARIAHGSAHASRTDCRLFYTRS